jgi:hypothetical protein
MADAVQMADHEVVLDGQSYSAIAVPAPDSGVVDAERNRLLKNLKLESLIANLTRAGELLNLAYNGVAGFGNLRGAVTGVSDRLRVLAADCQFTMQQFERSARTITGNLRDCFKFLLNGREEAVIFWLGKAGVAAHGMADEAVALADRFDTLGDDIVQTLVDTQKAQGETEEARAKLEAQIAELNARDTGARKLAEELVKQKAELQQLYDEAKEKAETAENRAFALSIVNAIMRPLGEGLGSFADAMTGASSPAAGMIPPNLDVPAVASGGNAASQTSGDAHSLAESYRKQKEDYLTKLLELKKIERETVAKFAEYTVDLKNPQGQATIYVESLLQAVGALKGISTTLRLDALFWRQMGDHCKELAESDLKGKIEVYKTFADRTTYYRAPDFKERLVRCMAGWKAVEVIAASYGVECGKVRERLNEDFNKNPSMEESRKLVPVLGAKLLEAADMDVASKKAEEAQVQQELDATRQAA